MAPLGTDGLVVLIVPPIRDVMLGLILPLVLVSVVSVVVVRERLLVLSILALDEFDGLLDVSLGLIELPMRDVMLGLMLPLELAPGEVEGLL